MKQILLINRRALFFVGLSLAVNLFFLHFLYNKHVYFAISQAHGQVGYHVYHCNRIGVDPALTAVLSSQMQDQQCLIDYNQIELQDHVHEPFCINDTVAYGVLLGILWKITDSLQFYDVQLLQIIMFSLLMLLYYQIAYLLFGSTQIATTCGVFQLLFFPLVAYNVMPVRDVWTYYGMLMFLYALLTYYNNQISPCRLIWCFLFFSGCLWMRPTLACSALLLTLYAIMYLLRYQAEIKKIVLFLTMLWSVTGVCFWLPYTYFNHQLYGRCFVSPAGQSLLEGLGELPNRWGHKLNDEYVNEFITKKYRLHYGTIAFDDAAMNEFKSCVKQDPWHYMKTLLYRLPDVMLPGLQWIFYQQSPYVLCSTLWQKLSVACSSWSNFINFVARHLCMRLYLVCSYGGLLVLWRQKQYVALSCIMWCMLSSFTTYPSHIEYRYIIPFYWILSLSLGYLWYYMCSSFYERQKRAFMQKIVVILCLILHNFTVCADYGPWLSLYEKNLHYNSIAQTMLSLSEKDMHMHKAILYNRLKLDAQANIDTCIAFAQYASSMLDWQDTKMLKQRFDSMKNRFSSSQGAAKKAYVDAVQKNFVARLMAFRSFKPYIDTFKEAQDREFKSLSASQQAFDIEKWQVIKKEAIDYYCTQITGGLSQVQSILQKKLEEADDECCKNYSWESHYARMARILFRFYAVDTQCFEELVYKRVSADAQGCINEIKAYVHYMNKYISWHDKEKIIQCLDEERALLASPSDEYINEHASRLESLFNIQIEVEDINPYFKALGAYTLGISLDEHIEGRKHLNNVKQEMMRIYFKQVGEGLQEARDLLLHQEEKSEGCKIS